MYISVYVAVLQLEKSGAEYERISEKLTSLYQQSFDADPATLFNLQQYPCVCCALCSVC